MIALKFSPADDIPPVPKGLSREAARWWRRLHSGYELADEGAQLLLETALQALDRMREARKVLDAEGLTVRDRFGQAKAHPLIVVERDSRAAMVAALKALNLSVEPLNDAPGRPPGSGKGG